MSAGSALTAALRRDRWIVLAALTALTLLAWLYIVVVARSMSGMPAPAGAMPGMDMPGMDMSGMDMPGMNMAPALAGWGAGHALVMFCMWAVMMVGMMTPSVAPMVLLYIGIAERGVSRGHAFAPAGWFVGGYLAAWLLFSVLAVLAQWSLEALALLDPAMRSASRPFGAAVLIAAGIYQWLPLKDACLAQCRAPLSFVQRHGGFQADASGSLRLGLLHGLYCVGCCWLLMLLLFVVGVMNLLWIAALMMFVLLEKALPHGRYLSRAAGLAAVAAGIWMLRPS